VLQLVLPATSGGVKLKGPQEVAGGLEVGANSVNLVNKILIALELTIKSGKTHLNADDTLVAQSSLDHAVVGDGDALADNLGISTLVDELLHGLQVGVSVDNVGLNNAEHVDGGLVQLDENTVVDLDN
jgi:hypothetical protein